MNKLLILVTTASFSFAIAPNLLAQETAQESTNCSASDCTELIQENSSHGSLTETKWQAIALRYYQSRLRDEFQTNNNLLSIWDVKEFLGFSGTKVRTSQVGNRQYWVWRDRENPQRKITAIFDYYQLVDLQGSEFDKTSDDFIQELTSHTFENQYQSTINSAKE